MKNPSTALFLSFLIPGLGFFYAGHIRKFLSVNIFLWLLIFTYRNFATTFLLFVVFLSIALGDYLFGLINSYGAAKRPIESKYVKWYNYLLILIINIGLSIVLIGPPLDRLTRVNFAHLPTPIMEPNMLVGDYFAHSKRKDFERGNITTFGFPPDPFVTYVSRCVGAPGDSIKVVDGRAIINGVVLDIENLQHQYLVKPKKNQSMRQRVFDQVGVRDAFRISDGYMCFLSNKQVEQLNKTSFIEDIQPIFNDNPIPENPFLWSPNDFGPLLIPKVGDRIELTDRNVQYYVNYILNEDIEIEFDGDKLLRRGESLSTYEFKKNYYFMMGDNRANSFDSRYWGLVSENLMIGRVNYVYWAENADRIGTEF